MEHINNFAGKVFNRFIFHSTFLFSFSVMFVFVEVTLFN